MSKVFFRLFVLASRFERKDWLSQANYALRQDMPAAACVLARIAIEQHLRDAVRQRGEKWKHKTAAIGFLYHHGVITERQRENIRSQLRIANKAVHGLDVSYHQVNALLNAARNIRKRIPVLDLEGGAA